MTTRREAFMDGQRRVFEVFYVALLHPVHLQVWNQQSFRSPHLFGQLQG